jgi:hypothetical protein
VFVVTPTGPQTSRRRSSNLQVGNLAATPLAYELRDSGALSEEEGHSSLCRPTSNRADSTVREATSKHNLSKVVPPIGAFHCLLRYLECQRESCIKMQGLLGYRADRLFFFRFRPVDSRVHRAQPICTSNVSLGQWFNDKAEVY